MQKATTEPRTRSAVRQRAAESRRATVPYYISHLSKTYPVPLHAEGFCGARQRIRWNHFAMYLLPFTGCAYSIDRPNGAVKNTLTRSLRPRQPTKGTVT